MKTTLAPTSFPWKTFVLLALAGEGTAQETLSPFDATTIAGVSGAPPFRRLADIDLDGDVDGVGWQVSTDGSAIRTRSYVNDGNGVFASGVWWATQYDASESLLVLGELGLLDAGPTPDLCMLHGDQRHVLLGNGDGSFTAQPFAALPAEATALALADLDGDGRDDFVWTDGLYLRLTTSTGSQTAVLHGLGGPMTLRVLPADGPGGTDVFLLLGDSLVRLFHGSQTTGLVPGPSFAHGLMMTMFDTGDVDGDGDADGVVFGAHDYRVLRRLDAGTWTLEASAPGGPAEFLRDVDGDGDLDGACCGGGGTTWESNDKPSTFEIALNDGSGAFAPAFQLRGMGSPQLAGVADVDADGDLDLVAGVCVYFAKGAVRPPPAAPPGSVIPPMGDPRDVADCDGDGDLDVGFTLDSSFLNDGAGNFYPESHGVSGTPAGTRYRGSGYPGDFDGDGDVDLLAELFLGPSRAQRAGGAGHGTSSPLGMALLANDGGGALGFGGLVSAPGVTFALDSLEARASRTADLDLDGDLDLVTRAVDALANRPTVSRLWLNDGTGSFTAAPFVDDRRVETVADLDLDGRPDLVTTEYPLYFGLPNLRILRALAAPPSPPAYVDDVGRAVGRLYSGGVSTGNLFSMEFPDPGYPDLLFMGCCSQGAWLEINGYDPAVSSWGGVILGNALPADAIVEAGDLDLDGLDDQLAGAYGTYVKRSDLRFKVGPLWWDTVTASQILPTGHLVDVDQDGDLDLLGERIVLNRTVP